MIKCSLASRLLDNDMHVLKLTSSLFTVAETRSSQLRDHFADAAMLTDDFVSYGKGMRIFRFG